MRMSLLAVLISTTFLAGIPTAAQTDPIHQEILDKLTDLQTRITNLETKISTIETEVTATEQPVTNWTHRWCMKVPINLSLNVRDKAEAAGLVLGSLGARVFGNGGEGQVKINGKFEVFMALQPGIGLEYTYCGPQLTSLAPAQGSTNTLADRVMKAAAHFGVNETTGSNALDLLNDYDKNTFDPMSLLADGETALTKALKVLPLSDGLRGSLPTGSELVAKIMKRMESLCTDNSFPSGMKAKITEFCKLGKAAPNEVWAASNNLIQEINGDVRELEKTVGQMRKDINEIYQWVESIYKRLP